MEAIWQTVKIFNLGGNFMRYEWGKEEIQYINKKVPVVKRISLISKLIEQYYWWAVLTSLVVANIWVWWMNYQIYTIRLIIKSI